MCMHKGRSNEVRVVQGSRGARDSEVAAQLSVGPLHGTFSNLLDAGRASNRVALQAPERVVEAIREHDEITTARKRVLGADYPDTLRSRHRLNRLICQAHVLTSDFPASRR